MKKILILVILLICTNSSAIAQEAVGTEPISKPILSEVITPSGMVTFNFKDADIRNVLRLIAAKSGVNIVYGPEVSGVVNMELKDVPWEQALSLVLDLNGFAFQKTGNVIKVLKKEDLVKEPLSTEVFVLNYASAEESVESVKQMLTERGSIKTNVRSNTIIVTDIPANVNKVETVLKRLDTRTPQVLIETKILEMKNSLEKDLGVKWSALKEYKITVESPSRQYSSNRGSGQDRSDAYFKGDEDYLDYVKQRDWTYIPEGTVSDTTTVSTYDILSQNLVDTFTRTLTKTDIRSAILSAADFEVVLSALQADTDVNLISNPRILTANNEKAEIKVVSEYPVPNYEFDTETSQWSITGFDKEEIGVIFNVTPNISSDGYITMDVQPQVSTMIGLVPFTAGGATVEIPYIGRKLASAKLVIHSGDTLAIGGLIDEDKNTIITKVPLLGDIPVLGRLFRHDDIENVKKDVIFFITGTIINEDNKSMIIQPEGEVDKYDSDDADFGIKPNSEEDSVVKLEPGGE